MKKYLILLITLLLSTSGFATVSAGSIPEDLLHEENAQVFISTMADSESSENTISVIPTEKIKGDVEIGKVIQVSSHYAPKLKPDTEYLVGIFGNKQCYIYEVKSRSGSQIKLADADRYDMTKRLEDYLNDGSFARAESLRANSESHVDRYVSHTVWYLTGVTFIFLLILTAGHFVYRKKHKNQ